ncbi:hypothetical protein [Burkholderia pyrrocinia]|uniref:hypothetical protein n=1 Tax=Burkholderia pyrrocinia TaxID=60550 RepID=UPI001BCF5ADE|nr:hypothetical protein [Burkholderia pyrrocinia]QVN23255.1 hypothetical protein JYG32_38315 [Burkholderia pyrrocinia]
MFELVAKASNRLPAGMPRVMSMEHTTSTWRPGVEHGRRIWRNARRHWRRRLSASVLVDARRGRMQALGTHFIVQKTERFTLLVSFDGKIRICNSSGRVEVVAAGQ